MITRRTLLCAGLIVLIACCGVIGFKSATGSQTATPAPISGDYLEVRSCDVYTGPCFANGEMNLTGGDAILSWSIRQGSFEGVKLDGLNVLAVVRAENTMGDVNLSPQKARSVLIVDAGANTKQREALVRFAKSKAGAVLGETVRIDAAPVTIDSCPQCLKGGCAKIQAGDLVEIETRCLGGKDCVCGNEELYYPPLTSVTDARPAFTIGAVFRGQGLDTQFDEAGRRSAYLAQF
jgi:hypothetical protein